MITIVGHLDYLHAVLIQQILEPLDEVLLTGVQQLHAGERVAFWVTRGLGEGLHVT